MNVQKIAIDWHPGLPIYASERFLQTVSDTYGWLGGFDESGEPVCILPYSIISKTILRIVRFSVQTIPLKEDLRIEDERRFLAGAADFFRSAGVDLIMPATFNSVFRTYPEGAVAAPFGTYIVDLTQPEKTLWMNLHAKHRNVIRNAQKKGVKVHCGIEHLPTVYGLVYDSFQRSAASGLIGRMRSGFRMDYEAFKRQVTCYGDNVCVFLVEHEGDFQAGAVIPFSRHSAYYHHGGGIDHPLTGAMNLLQWEMIRHFQELGVKRYDFFGARIDPEKGSKMEGIIRFKSRFGGELQRGYMWKYPFKPMKYELYRFASNFRSGGDVVDQEYHKLHAL